MKAFFFIICTLLIACSDGKQSNTRTVTVPVYQQDSIIYPSLSRYLDSLFVTDGVVPAAIPSSAHWPIANRQGQLPMVQAERHSGFVSLQYGGRQKGGAPPNNCYQFLQFGTKVFTRDTLFCWQSFQVDTSFSFNGSQFICLKAGPPKDCMGSLCRINYYALLAFNQQDTALQVIVNSEDMFGLRFGDVNRNGTLAFLEATGALDEEKLGQLVQTTPTFRRPECPNLSCYNFNLFSFRAGRWERVTDSSGSPRQIGIRVKEPLDSSTAFQLVY